jgi:hypothetical protein
VKELFNSLFETSKERIKSPLIGSYIIGFFIYNWRPIIIILFSNETVECRIEIIDKSYCVESALLWPLVIAGFYVLILPWINILIDLFLTYVNLKKQQKSNAHKISSLTQKKDEAILEREIAEALAGTSETTELREQLERLNQENEKLSEQNKSNFERFNNSLEMAKTTEQNLSLTIENLDKKYNSLKAEYDRVVSDPKKMDLNSDIESVLSKMNGQLKAYLISFTDFKIFHTKSAGISHSHLTQKLIDLQLIFRKNGEDYEISLFGKIIYDYIKINGLHLPF